MLSSQLAILLFYFIDVENIESSQWETYANVFSQCSNPGKK